MILGFYWVRLENMIPQGTEGTSYMIQMKTSNKILLIISFYFQCIHLIVQLVDSDWPANILAGLHFQAQESGAMSPDSVFVLLAQWLGMRLIPDLHHMSLLQLVSIVSCRLC